MTPPQTTPMSSPPRARKAAINPGASVFWAAARLETPMTWTSFSIAWRAPSSGRWERRPLSNPKPTSAACPAGLPAPRRLGERGEGGLTGLDSARLADLRQTGNLLVAHLVVVDVEEIDLRCIPAAVFVDADDDLLAAIDLGLAARRRLLDAQLGHAA